MTRFMLAVALGAQTCCIGLGGLCLGFLVGYFVTYPMMVDLVNTPIIWRGLVAIGVLSFALGFVDSLCQTKGR